ncbi:hypothetical protein HRbin25_00182 [bacterium HR25]|jgi:hypothetical protein|nr:hypothetical protein HRbin25_00182 [bacterium HR25]
MRLFATAWERSLADAERWLPWAMILLGLFGLYLLGMDQGQALGAFLGEMAFRNNWLHELFHDARHAGGFPCH